MAAQASPSKLAAFLTLFIMLGFILFISWMAFYYAINRDINHDEVQPVPTPTPQEGLYNIDEQLDLLN